MEFNTGNFKQFYWLETSDLTLGQIVSKLPELLIGKYLVSLYFDGSPKETNIQEIKDLNSLRQLPISNFDQWLLTKEEKNQFNFTDFVNYIYFSLIDWDSEIETLTDQDEIDFIKQYRTDRKNLKEKFWQELEEIDPINFISDGSKLIFVSKSQDEIKKIINVFSKPTN